VRVAVGQDGGERRDDRRRHESDYGCAADQRDPADLEGIDGDRDAVGPQGDQRGEVGEAQPSQVGAAVDVGQRPQGVDEVRAQAVAQAATRSLRPLRLSDCVRLDADMTCGYDEFFPQTGSVEDPPGLPRPVGKGEIDRPTKEKVMDEERESSRTAEPDEGAEGKQAEQDAEGHGHYSRSAEKDDAKDEQQEQAEQDAEGHGHYSRSPEEGDEEGGEGREKENRSWT
jgi:hypothetical protein